MKKKLIPLLSALLTVTLLAAMALFSGATTNKPDLKIAYCNIDFKTDAHLLYAVTYDGIESEKVDDIELLVWITSQSGFTGTPDHTLKKAGNETIDGDECVVFEFADLAAKNMTDNIYTRAHIKVDGEDYYSPVNKYSVLQYAYNILGKTKENGTTNEKLIDLLNNMLAYGASAQNLADYKTDRLATADWYQVKLNGGTLDEDGCDHGLYLPGDKVNITAPATDKDGNAFEAWTNSAGEIISTSASCELTVGEKNEVYTPTYKTKTSEGLKFRSNGDGTCYVAGIGDCTDTDIVIPETSPDGDRVTSIGDQAFYRCTSLTSITISDSVTSIGSGSFENCKVTKLSIASGSTTVKSTLIYPFRQTLTSIAIPDSVTSIGYDAFEDCGKLTSITIPDSVTNIGNSAFEDCRSLTSVTIGDGVTSIGYMAFYNCTSLESVTIGNSVTSIGNEAFCGCTNLTSITIPDNVTSIGSSAFYITAYYDDNANWTDGVLYIGNHLIDAKTSISGAYTIKNGTKCIADCAFNYCTSLTSITIPDSVTDLGGGAFYGCSKLKNVTMGNGIKVIKSLYYSSYNYYGTFENCSNLTSITIPDSVTSIGEDAFRNCTSLASITVPDSAKSIGRSAFYYTAYYKNEANWTDGVLYIGNHLIKAKTSISGTYTIKDGTKRIADYAFEFCTSLTSITIPDSVTSIGDYAFYKCSSLTSITIPDSVTSIGNYAFSGCTSLTSIAIPNSVISIGARAFNYCTSLTSITIGKGVTSIGGWAFSWCTRLTSITIPDSVKSVVEGAFYGCTSLESITIPDSVTSIGGSAFRECTSLTSITIGNGVTSIGNYTFYDCMSLTNITIPDSVTSIGDGAFNGWSRLKKVYYKGTADKWSSITIDSDYNSNLTSATRYYYSETQPTEAGYYWHYVDKVPMIWEMTTTFNYTVNDDNESCTITELIANTKDELIIPKTIDGYRVTVIGIDAFYNNKTFTSVIIPNSVTSIGWHAFSGCTSLKKVYYEGTFEQWLSISIGSDNSYLTSATRYYYSETEPTTDGNFWHYVDGVVTEW